MSLRVNSQHFPLPYFVLCTIGIVFARAIKTDEICVFCFKLLQNIVMSGAGLIWRCADQIFCLGLLRSNMVKPSFREQKVGLGLLGGKYGK